MPPRISRICQETTVVHPRCLLQQRTSPFSTSPIPQADIPPESPKYIEIPKQVQPHAIRRPWMKGILPTPRRIYTPKPEDQRKATTEYLASVTPEPLRERSTTADGRTKEFVSWKERQAERRRQNLREGLVELHHRDQRAMKKMEQRSSRTQAMNLALRDAPQREDERLTNPTVIAFESPFKKGGLPDPNREASLARKRENVARMQQIQEERRRVDLHTLFVNAQDFITTPAQLEKAVDKAFDDLNQFTSAKAPGLNIWNTGPPENIQTLLKVRMGISKSAIESIDENEEVSKRRLERIAGELTGGKMGTSKKLS